MIAVTSESPFTAARHERGSPLPEEAMAWQW